MPETFAVYSTDLTDAERDLGFEIMEITNPSARFSMPSSTVLAVVCRLSDTEQIIKMNIPVIGGHCYRHERLSATRETVYSRWIPVGSVVFPSAEQAVTEIAGGVRHVHACG